MISSVISLLVPSRAKMNKLNAATEGANHDAVGAVKWGGVTSQRVTCCSRSSLHAAAYLYTTRRRLRRDWTDENEWTGYGLCLCGRFFCCPSVGESSKAKGKQSNLAAS